MTKKQRRQLRTMLAGMDTGERNRLKKRAAGMRKAAAHGAAGGARRPQLEEFLWQLLGEADGAPEPAADGAPAAAASSRAGATPLRAPEPAAEGAPASAAQGGTGEAAAVEPAARAPRGVVIAEAPGACRVALAGGTVTEAALPEDLARRQRSDLAVGDEVLLERHGGGHRVAAVLPRRSLLTRADPQVPRRRHAIAANVDHVVVVVAAKAPPLHPRLIDRYLVAAEHAGATPVLVVNKTDLLAEDERADLPATLAPYRALGVAVLPCSVARGEGVDAVRATLAHSTCVFVGQSGVGKSSLLNALAGEAAAATGAVRAGDGRGHHTTTASTMYQVGDGTRVIDTPGIRRLGQCESDPALIAAGFAEFRRHSGHCRYRDCTHTSEPGCAVRRAVAAGVIARSRYQSYLKLVAGDDWDALAADTGA